MRFNIFYFSIIIIALSNLSFQWPLKNGRITSTFSESRGDHFHDGVDMVSPDDKIFPIDSGEIVYYWDKTIFPLDNYPGGGNFKILKHNNGIYSIYMHLEDGLNKKLTSKTDDVIGMVGNSGHSYAKHLHFSILNSKTESSKNAFLVMPKVSDLKKPEIKDIYLKIDKKYIGIRNNSKIRLTKHYPILINISDTITGKENLGIYCLKITFNTKKVVDICCNNLAYSSDGLKLSEKLFNNLFDEKGYYKVENIKYSDGYNILKVVATDYAGNTAEKIFSFDVKLDLEI